MAEGDGVELQTLLPNQGDGLNIEAASNLGAIWVLDGQGILQFDDVADLAEYLGAYPEAENDGAARVFHYTSKCRMELLVALFSKYEAWHLNMMLRSPVLKQPPSGFRAASCACPLCSAGRPCGRSGLEFSISFWQFDGAAEDREHRLEVAGSNETFSVFAGGQKTTFRLRPWSIQIFRFPTRRVQHTDTATDALLYHDDFSNVACASTPLEYVLSVMQAMVSNWALIIETSQRFLGFYSIEALNPRLETDRSIIRHLFGAAQLWKSLLSMIRAQITHLHPLNAMGAEDPWLRDSQDAELLLDAAKNSYYMLTAYESTIRENLLQEVDQLIQQMTNLITIDEGYRSRDMNTSIWRLSWVTFIFLPLVFASSVFGMNLDVFRDNPAWWYYFVFAVPLVVLVSALYLGFRSSASLTKCLGRKPPQMLGAGGEDQESLVDVNTVLGWAAATGQIDTVAGVLVSRGYTAAPSHAMGPGNGSPLVNAIATGNEAIMRLLVQQNPQAVHETDQQGATALHHAAGRGFPLMVEFLLDHGASITVTDSQGQTPLDRAIAIGEDKSTAAILRKLYEGDSTADAPPPGATSLHIACLHRDLNMVRRLIASGYNRVSRDADGRKDAEGRIAPFTAMKQGHDFFVEVANLYTDNDLKDTDYHGVGLLHAAVRLGLLDTVKYLVGRGLDVELKTAGYLNTPLHYITFSPEDVDRLAIVRFLCESGASKDLQNADGSTVSHLICQEGRPDSVSLLQCLLLQSERRHLKAQDNLGRTPVHIAATTGHLPTIRQLLSGVNAEILSIRDRDGLMAVDLAARAGHLDSFQLLRPNPSHAIEAVDRERFHVLVGALVAKDDLPSLQQAFTLPEAQGRPLALSSRVFQQAIAAGALRTLSFMLREKPDWVTCQWGPYNCSVLLNAIASGNPDLVDFLLDANAPVGGQDDSGWNALHVAAFWGLRPSTTKRIADSNHSTSLRSAGLKDQKDAYGWIPYDLAYFYVREELYDILAPERLAQHVLPWTRRLEGGEQNNAGGIAWPGSASNAWAQAGRDATELTELPC